MKRSWACFLLLFTICVAPLLLAQEDDDAEPRPIPSRAALAGRKVFQQKCGFCHGAEGSGGQGPDLLHSSLVLHDENGNLITPIVRDGRPDKGMPAFPLERIQVQQIAAFLHHEINVDATIFYTDSTANYALKRLLVGNAADGKVYFNGKGGCSACHSPTGDLAHIASKYKPIQLQSRIVYPAGVVPTITVTLPSGGTISGKEVYNDPFVISLRDSDGWIHSFPAGKVEVQVKDPLAEHKTLLTVYTDKVIHDLFAYLETLK